MDAMKALKLKIYKSGIPQVDIAKFLDMHPSTLNRILSGKEKPYFEFGSNVDGAIRVLCRAKKAAEEAHENEILKSK